MIVEYSAILDRLYPPNYPIHAAAFDNLSSVQNALKEYSEAEKNARRAVEIGEKYWGKVHRNLWAFRSDLAIALIGLKRYAEAERLLLNVIDEQNATMNGEVTGEFVNRVMSLATIFYRTNRIELGKYELANLEKKLSLRTR